MTKSEKLALALRMRDAALLIIKEMGEWKGVGDNKSRSAKIEGVSISYRTPFQKLPPTPDELKYKATQLGLVPRQNLSYGLDIWAPKKVLNIEWNDSGETILVSFRRGTWEKQLRALAASFA